MATSHIRPMVGVAAIVHDQGRLLLGKRLNAHGSGCWSFPGGHLEAGETWQDCARRELMEETGLKMQSVTFHACTNDIFLAEAKHYITIFMLCSVEAGTPRVLEPNKCETWQWFMPQELPAPLFLPIQNLLLQDSLPGVERHFLHLIRPADWQAVCQGDYLHCASLDNEGFIHCAWADQADSVIERFFPDVSQVMALQVDPTRLLVPVDTSTGYPHVRGALNLGAIVRVFPLEQKP